MSESAEIDKQPQPPPKRQNVPSYSLYRIRFRKDGQISSGYSKIAHLSIDEVVMVQTKSGVEPAVIYRGGIKLSDDYFEKSPSFPVINRRATNDEKKKYENLIMREDEAFALCRTRISELKLQMKLIAVERYFNGSKVIFYFTADSRVDFRELVKNLVQEFRTRVEMKQVGVRHETKMVGGLGCCGREFCCSSFIGKFAPVSIKMAKDQDLPLNPVKISGVCNRLLCCLTHEHATYKTLRKGMPRPGKHISLDGKSYKVIQNNVLVGTITVISPELDGPTILPREEWQGAVIERKPQQVHDNKKKQARKPRGKNSKEGKQDQPKSRQGRSNRQNRAPKQQQSAPANKQNRPNKFNKPNKQKK